MAPRRQLRAASARRPSPLLLIATLACFLLLCVQPCLSKENISDDRAKDEAELWFQKQAPGTVGKEFVDKVSCKAFYTHFDAAHPNYYKDTGRTKMHVVNICKAQKQVERDRRDLQSYAVHYFSDPEETAMATCEEFADDFVSEYTRFKGEKTEAAAYCYFFREEGSLKALRDVQTEHKGKTRTMDDATKHAQQIHEQHVVGTGKGGGEL
mmetsp:Transcript_14238/g.28128  ORF Transcript_14238/g.28128 Transcript_14238/m.28128 type:complete len:210 (-) Transcript_14238:117-746(-)|eukprot:CAMPEP_0173393348 /NCGR_PEP_ID=MMETSP1356-20130122/22055_1 /TAXON_ID=77927 ORGANISM="Hemiselmis virescens, Strain PCC157" /NCGR_SAMPLE_ID=MMETSP1356 /ASSEMBLY_ACC=CAM_ASM_000847 /LENGTH=209 /DNA_ID=CAMNT_0014351355 /DNA_START=345 /DNA_END=974 /DNA_ORIENTATION=-